jgi:hypothetical protein
VHFLKHDELADGLRDAHEREIENRIAELESRLAKRADTVGARDR